MIFLTLGTYPLSFDRLLIAIDHLCGKKIISDEVFGQIGHTTYKPKNFNYKNILPKEEFDEIFNNAEAVISHAGIGTISMALEFGKPLLVMPRLSKYNEAVNDHQVGTAKEFEKLGHIISVYDEKGLLKKIKYLTNFKPLKRENQVVLVAKRIQRFLYTFS